MIEAFACVVLTHPIPGTGLQVGDIGAVLHAYDDGVFYDVEFVTTDGVTACLLILSLEDVMPVDEDPEDWGHRPVSNTSIPHVALSDDCEQLNEA